LKTPCENSFGILNLNNYASCPFFLNGFLSGRGNGMIILNDEVLNIKTITLPGYS